jgi:hypothetical protein
MAFDEVLTETSRLCRVLEAMAAAGFPMQRIDDHEPGFRSGGGPARRSPSRRTVRSAPRSRVRTKAGTVPGCRNTN